MRASREGAGRGRAGSWGGLEEQAEGGGGEQWPGRRSSIVSLTIETKEPTI